jgi:hypothetical protein
MTTSYTAKFPLAWPAGWKRTRWPKSAPFKVTPRQAEQELLAELDRMGASQIVISTDRRVNRDGSFSVARQALYDMGVAIYFTRKGRDVVLACDQYDEIHANIRAIGKTIEALRGIERWGASDMLDRAFTGFEALPAPQAWWETLGLSGPNATRSDIAIAYRRASNSAHPDKPGGSHDKMAAVNAARDEGLARFGV